MMARAAPKTVDDYLEQQPERTRAALEKVRAAIQRTLPQAEEVISYKIPAYRINGRVALYFAGWKEHYSLYPVGDRVMSTLKKELASHNAQRGTIRFPLDQPVPTKLVARIASLRAEETLAKGKPKRAAKKS